MKRGKHIAIAIGITFVLIFTLRETEIVYWNYFKTSLKGERKSNWNSELIHFVSGTPHALANAGLIVSSKTTDRLNARFARILSDQLREQHINGTVTVDFQKWFLKGLYWIPLHKNGQLEYSVSVDANLQQHSNEVKVLGTVFGKVDITVSGPCSLAEFNAILLRDIASNIIEQLKSDLNKPVDGRATIPPAP